MPFQPTNKKFKMDAVKAPSRTSMNQSDYEATSKGLAKAGLGCKVNTPLQVEHSVATVKNGFSKAGTRNWLSTPRLKKNQHLLQGSSNDDYTYDIADAGEFDFFDKMAYLLQNLATIKSKNYYYVDEQTTHGSFKSTAMAAIEETFTKAGQIIGQVSNGHVDPDQLMCFVGDILSQLTETSSSDFESTRSGSLFLVTEPNVNDGTVESISGISYYYKFTVKDFKEKKVETHDATYVIEQKNISFTDPDMLEKIYQQVLNSSK